MAALPYDNFRLYNRGPLTTTFIPPSTCLATTSEYIAGLLEPPSDQTTYYYIGLWPPALPNYLTDYTSNACIPPAATPIPLAQPWYYSPGICPSSYTLAVSLATGHLGTYDSEAALPESVRAWLCCPLSYTPSPGITDAPWSYTITCTSTAPGPATLTNVWPVSSGDFESSSIWPITPPTGDVKSTVVVTKPIVIAEGIPIMWESTDVQVQSWFDSYQPTSRPSTTNLTTTILTTTPSSTNTQTSRALSPGRGSSLSVAMLGALSLIASLILYS